MIDRLNAREYIEGMYRIFVISSVVVFILSLAINAYFFNSYIRTLDMVTSQRRYSDALKKYSLLAPRTLQDRHGDFLLNFLDLRRKLHVMADPLGDNMELYFEYLPTGTSLGINSGNNFFAASLFKLPVVMAYYRHKERITSTKDYTVRLTKDMLDDRFGDLWQKGEGYELDLDDGARLALVKSDNTAAKALGTVITQDDFDDVYLGVDVDLQIASEGAVMTTKKYSSILKALYYSAVLTRGDSQTILDYLSQSEFNDKLVAGIPKDVVVAHKIGVIDEKSYMDCGIVYIPRRPYILCMVSRGNEDEARNRMKSLSKIIYDYVLNAQSPTLGD